MASSSSPSFVLPEDIVEAILAKLPVRSLIRFRLLSKNIKELIDNPRFAVAHLDASSPSHEEHSMVLLTVHDNPQGIRHDLMLTLSKQREEIHHKEEQLPVFVPHHDVDGRYQLGDLHYIDLLGSHNGLICLCLHYAMIRNDENYYNNKKIVLWNPATKQSRILPPLPSSSHHLARVCGVVDLGFAYIHETADYMVSGIIGLINDDANGDVASRMCYQVDVFSMRKWEWKTYIHHHELASNIPKGCISSLGPSHAVALRGIIYRVVSVFAVETCHNFVLSMNMNSSISFDRIEFPEMSGCWVSNLMVYGKEEDHETPSSLGLFSNVGTEEDGLSWFKCNIWVLNNQENDDDSYPLWTKLFTISIHHSASIDHPLGSWGDGRIIIRRTVTREGNNQTQRRRIVGNDVLVYNHHHLITDREGLMIDIPIGIVDFVSLNACTYIESLVSLYPY